MEVIYLLIPVSVALIGVIAWIFIWAIRSGQFDDLEGPAHRILMEDDDSINLEKPEQNGAETPPGTERSGTVTHRSRTE